MTPQTNISFVDMLSSGLPTNRDSLIQLNSSMLGGHKDAKLF
jgi:hypothetical protein